MCGRFSLTDDPSELIARILGERVALDPPFRPRYNIAPTQDVVTVAMDAGGDRFAAWMRWGLIPAWVKDPSALKSDLINARLETAAAKPAFRHAFRHRRCVVLADGFYEWKAVPGARTKQPYRIRLKGGGVFAFAGLWDRWRAPDGAEVRSCTILTTSAHPRLAEVHDRMPVMLTAEAAASWLDPAVRDPRALVELARPLPDEALEIYPVSRLVNSPANDVPEVLLPAATSDAGASP